MVVFIETVLFENLVVDSFLLWSVCKFLKQKPKWGGIFLASSVGAVFALFSVSLPISTVFAVVLKLFVAVLMCFLMNFSFKRLFLKTVLFVFLTFSFGGILLAIFSFLGVSTSAGVVLGYNSSIPVGAICVLVVVFSLFLLKLLKTFFKAQKVEKLCFDLTLTLNKKSVCLKGFLDTGNTLLTKCGKPVLILNESKLKNWFDKSQRLAFLLSDKFEKLKVKSVAGTKILTILDAEKCVVEKKEIEVAIGVCEDGFFKKSDFDIILNQKMLEVLNV